MLLSWSTASGQHRDIMTEENMITGHIYLLALGFGFNSTQVPFISWLKVSHEWIHYASGNNWKAENNQSGNRYWKLHELHKNAISVHSYEHMPHNFQFSAAPETHIFLADKIYICCFGSESFKCTHNRYELHLLLLLQLYFACCAIYSQVHSKPWKANTDQ